MKRLLLLFFALLLTACQNKPFNPKEVRHLSIFADNIYYQDEDGTVFYIENGSDKPTKTDLEGNIFQIDGKVYLVGGGKICVLSNGSFAEMGTAPNSTIVELIGIVEDCCYYIEWGELVSWNYKTSERNDMYSFGDAVNYPFGVTTDGVFYGTHEGLFELRFTKSAPGKIFDGNITSVRSVNDTVFFAVSTLREDTSQDGGKQSQVYDGAAYYKYDGGNPIMITTVEHVGSSSTKFAVIQGMIYGVASNADQTESILWWMDDNGELSQVTLSEKIDVSGGIEVDNNMIVMADMQANIWLFSRANNTLRMLTKQ